MELEILLAFQNLQEVNYIFKMAASTGLKEVRILILRLLYLSYFISDFDQVCGRLHGLIRACISVALASTLPSPLTVK